MRIIIKRWIINILSVCGISRLSRYFCKNSFRILLYHSIGAHTQGDYLGLRVSVEDFREHMKMLKDNGYNVLALRTVAQMLKEKRFVPYNSIVITFDDGYSENFQEILKILRAFNFSATFFINVGYLSKDKKVDKYWEKWDFLTPDGLREIAASGNDIGLHGLAHADLTKLPKDKIEEDIINSKKILEDIANKKIDIFSYPHGKFNEFIKASLKRNGFIASCCSMAGVNCYYTDSFELKRTNIDGRDNIFTFRKKILGYYDWF